MLVAEHSKRATIDMVCAELDAICKYCLDNPDTCFIGQPVGERDDDFPPPFTESVRLLSSFLAAFTRS